MFDLSYVQDPDKYDKYVSDNADLLELDESFKESYLEIIQRFYTLFEGIFNYFSNLQSYLMDIKDGKYIEFTWDAILQDKDGKRNMVECVYHYGAMLLLLDRLIPSLARERIVTCYLRYMGSSASPLHSKVTKLIKATGYFLNKSSLRETIPEKYPANYFSRFKIDRMLVESLINAMKDDDIYDKISVYGNNPQHRSVALATQASIIFAVLPFCPAILDNAEPKMREICDKHFPDNWVIPIYGGVLVDLLAYWQSFPAAKKALENNIVPERVTQLCEYHAQELTTSSERINRYIVEGQLQEKEALDNVKELLACLRDANRTIRWVMLHEHATHQGMLQVIQGIIKEEQLVKLLLKLSKFEHLLKELLTQIVKKKSKMWLDDKEQSIHDMSEISEFFAGNRDWGGEYEDEDLSEWFGKIAGAIEEFEYKNTTKVGRKIQKMIVALEDLQLQHSIIDTNALILDKVSSTMNRLHHMIRIMGIKKQVLEHMTTISEFSYAWMAMARYRPHLQNVIASDPRTVLNLKTVFLKMSTIMDLPLAAIMKAGSEDFESVAKYYSGQLFEYVKLVLSVIPRSIFKELDAISKIMSDQLKEFEVKISKDVLKESTKIETRFELAKKTHEITLLTEGMLKLDNVLMGVIEIEPKEILVDGLRRELCRTLAQILHEGFIFQSKATPAASQVEVNKDGVKI